MRIPNLNQKLPKLLWEPWEAAGTMTDTVCRRKLNQVSEAFEDCKNKT